MTKGDTEESKKPARNVVSSDEESNKEESPEASHKIATKRKSRPRRTSISSVHSHEKHYVEHNYHDHSHDPMDPVGVGPAALIEDPATVTSSSSVSTMIKKQRRGHRGGVAVPFPDKLHYMLSRMHEEDTEDIVSWQPHGRCFTVHKPKEFVSEIMPR